MEQPSKRARTDAPASRVIPRPQTASGQFLRVVTVNDSYKLDNYPHLASAVAAQRAAASDLGCEVLATLNGDFLSPSTLTALDGGRRLMEGLNYAGIDYVCLGNHEFDLGFPALRERLKLFQGTVINSNCTNDELSELPKHVLVNVGGRRVLLGGFVTLDKSIYVEAKAPKGVPVPDACIEVWEQAKKELGYAPDLFLPMTHQLLTEDRLTGAALAKHAELNSRTPILLGGHEHEVIVQQVNTKAIVVKVGQDAESIGIVDLWWSEGGELRSSFTVLPALDFPSEPVAAEFVRKQALFLDESMNVPIVSLAEDMSSERVRFEESGIASFLLSLVKRGLAEQGVELVLLMGGAVRAGKSYEAGQVFTMGDLFAELAFENNMAVVQLEGSVIAEAIRFSRSMPKPAPGFLHADGDVEIDAQSHEVKAVGGKPFDLSRKYVTAIRVELLTGMNSIEPLSKYAEAHLRVPDLEACPPIKPIVLRVCMEDAWRRLFRFEECMRGDLKSQDILEALKRAFADVDKNGDGNISHQELLEFVNRRVEADKAGPGAGPLGLKLKRLASGTIRSTASLNLVTQMIKAIDADGDGQISMEEFKSLAQFG